MAAARARPARANIALAIAGLILVGTFLGWRIAQRPSAPTPIVTQPREQPVAAPSAGTREPARAAVREVRADVLPDTAAARASSAAEEPDEHGQERLTFIRRINTGDARAAIGDAVPLEVARLVGFGELRAAANVLLQMARDGDANACHALERLLSTCPGPGDDPAFEQRANDRKARNYQMMRSLRETGGSEELVERLQWSLDAGNAYVRGIWAEFCPARGAGDYEALREKIRRVLPPQTPAGLEEEIRKRRPQGRELNAMVKPWQQEMDAAQRKRVDANVIEAQIGMASEQLYDKDPAARETAAAMLRSLSSVSPRAAGRLAQCALRSCAPSAGGIDGARELALRAVRGGDPEA